MCAAPPTWWKIQFDWLKTYCRDFSEVSWLWLFILSTHCSALRQSFDTKLMVKTVHFAAFCILQLCAESQLLSSHQKFLFFFHAAQTRQTVLHEHLFTCWCRNIWEFVFLQDFVGCSDVPLIVCCLTVPFDCRGQKISLCWWKCGLSAGCLVSVGFFRSVPLKEVINGGYISGLGVKMGCHFLFEFQTLFWKWKKVNI